MEEFRILTGISGHQLMDENDLRLTDFAAFQKYGHSANTYVAEISRNKDGRLLTN